VQKLASRNAEIMEKLSSLVTSDRLRDIHTAECLSEAVATQSPPTGLPAITQGITRQFSGNDDILTSLSDMEIDHVPSSTVNGITNGLGYNSENT